MVQGEHFSLNPGFWDLPKDIFYVYLVIAFLSGVGTKSANTCFSICWHHSSITLQLALKSSANKQFLYVSICVYISIYVTIHHLSSTKPIWPDTSESGEDCVNVHCTIFIDFFGMPVCSVMSDSLQHHGLWPVSCSAHAIFQARILGWVSISYSRGSSPPRDQSLCLLHCQADSLPLCHPGSPIDFSICWKFLQNKHW